jgi:hypothetical protein
MTTYQTTLEPLMLSHFEADSIPCEEFTAIHTAWKSKKVLTAAEISASLSTVLESPEESGEFPAELLTSIVSLLEKQAAGKPKKEKVAKTEKPVVRKGKKSVEAEKPAEAEKAKPVRKGKKSVEAVEPAVEVEVEVEAEAEKAKPVRKGKKSEKPVEPVEPVEPVQPIEPSPDAPVRALNAVALFSRIVSLIQKPSDDVPSGLTELADQEYTLSDGFKPESKLYSELEEKGVLKWVGQKKSLRSLITSVIDVLQKPAIISVSAVVRWFLSSTDQAHIISSYRALNLPEPARKVKKAKKTKKEKKAKQDRPKRIAQGYSLFTQRVGLVMKDPSLPFGDLSITLTDSQSEAARATALAKGKPSFMSILTDYKLKLGTTHQIRDLLKVFNTGEGTPLTVVRISGLLWSMSDSSTREKLLA